MGRPRKEETENKQQETGDVSKKQLDSFLKENKDDHYNFQETIYYKVPTGSLLLDKETDGGFMPGLHRFCGMNEGGKTSETFEVMRNFFLTISNSKGFLVKSEGRLSKEMEERSGIKFVYNSEEWEYGTCFVLESNIYETSFQLIGKLIKENPNNIRYMFVVDSVDGLILKDDISKPLTDSVKVAGGAVISSVFMKKVALAMSKFGHICILISQVRSEIKLDPYSKAPPKQTSATGGNALLHYANFIFDFEPRYNKDYILEKPDQKADRETNKIIGHWAKIIIKKSPNEKTNVMISYPIKYGRKNGHSIWIEREIVDRLLTEEYFEKNGMWYNFPEDFVEELKENKIECNVKFQGLNNLYDEFEKNKELFQYCLNKIKKDDEILEKNKNYIEK